MNTYAVLAEPTRRTLLDTLRNGSRSVAGLTAAVGASQPVVSKHLRILRDARLVNVERRGQQRLYSLNAAPLHELDDWLAPYRTLWANRLDGLEQHLHNSTPAKRDH